MRKNRICLNAVSRKIPDSLSEDRLMFSSAGAQPISLKSFRGLGHFPNKIARVYKHEHCLLPCVVLKSFCIEYSAKGAVELAVSIAAGAGVLLLSMAVSWLFFRKDPMAQIGVAFSNAGFMGLPLVTAVLGGEAVFYAAGFVALLNALQ